jgi:hypothetical protein
VRPSTAEHAGGALQRQSLPMSLSSPSRSAFAEAAAEAGAHDGPPERRFGGMLTAPLSWR